MRRATTAVVLATLLSCSGGGPPPERPSILLVILDTTRADHFSSDGYERTTTANLDLLAREGERYANAWAQSPWTLPAVASILTGQPPHVHGAGRTPQGMLGIRREVPTLAERLAGAGYRTAAFINVVWCSPGLSGLDRGFELYDYRESDETNRDQRTAEETNQAVFDWLREVGTHPFFAVVHYFDPHLTYDPPAPFDSLFSVEDGPRIPRGFGSASEVFRIRRGEIELDDAMRRSLIARYDGELAYTDEQFAMLRWHLRRTDRWDDTLVIVVGDHGEEFWDHGGFEHGHTHYRELLRVPLIVRRPGGPSGVVRDGRARQIDIAPTILDHAGLPVPEELPGRVLDGGSAAYSVAEGSLWAGDVVSIRGDAGTLIVNKTRNERIFFGPEDGLESHPLSAAPAAADLEQVLSALPPRPEPGQPARPLSPEELERLRSLGYVE